MQEETQILITKLNEEIALQNTEDDPFTSIATDILRGTENNKGNGEIPPFTFERKQAIEDQLATPLIPELMNKPLPQRESQKEGRHKTSEILPDDSQRLVQGKPPSHNNKSTRCQINYDNMAQTQNLYNQTWKVNNMSYLQLPTNTPQAPLEQLSINDTPDLKVCYRCGYEGHIKRHCNNYVYCDFCRTYSHHISLCRSYSKHMRMQPMTSSRRNLPTTHYNTHTQRVREQMTVKQTPENNHSKRTPNKEEGISEITWKYENK